MAMHPVTPTIMTCRSIHREGGKTITLEEIIIIWEYFFDTCFKSTIKYLYFTLYALYFYNFTICLLFSPSHYNSKNTSLSSRGCKIRCPLWSISFLIHRRIRIAFLFVIGWNGDTSHFHGSPRRLTRLPALS